MIKIIKLGDLIYQHVEEKTLDENGNEVWNIPTDLSELKAVAIDTINWVSGDKIKKSLGDNQTLLSASNSKAIVLLAKLVATLNPDTSTLTNDEATAYQALQDLANAGYADSQLLNTSLQSVLANVDNSAIIQQVEAAITVDEVIAVLNNL